MTAKRKQKVAILGGGMAALTAAFELTEQDKESERYDITIYTQGWRLGGKGAVGRERDKRSRATEHGLHVLAGFYDNAFDVIQRCYATLPEPPFGSWQDAFVGLDHWTLMDEVKGKWQPWRLFFPPNSLTPGISESTIGPADFVRYLVAGAEELFISSGLRDHIETLVTPPHAEDQAETPPLTLARKRVDAMPREPSHITDDHRDGILGSIDRSVLLLTGQRPSPQKARRPGAPEAGRDHKPDRSIGAFGGSLELRRALTCVELGLVIARGLVQENVFSSGFDVLDTEEWSAWMEAHGCSPETLDSALVRGCYNYVFGFLNGAKSVGAGTGTRALLRLLLGAKGHLFYVPRATLGEVVFAPLYRALAARRVNFAFFHRVNSLHLSNDGRRIESIKLRVQANPKNPRYRPLFRLPGNAGLWSWPSRPRYAQLQEGAQLQAGKELEGGGFDLESDWTEWPGVGDKALHRDTDFDSLILAISVGALPYICSELIEKYPNSWGAMAQKVKTTATLALQLWPHRTAAELGWQDSETLAAAFADPFNTWGDMSHLLALEAEPAPGKREPRSLAYFVGNFDGPGATSPPGPNWGFVQRERMRAAGAANFWMSTKLPLLWRKLRAQPGNIEQYLQFNINSSDRYVLSVPNSVQSRMPADGSGIDNLYLAGDWVRTGLNAGCLEAAVMSGRQAARAITGADIMVANEQDIVGVNFASTILPAIGLARGLGRLMMAGVGVLDACCIIHWASRDFVEGKLPAGVTLPPKEPGAPDAARHPMVLVFGRQSNVRPGFAPFGGLCYYEFAEIIPYVEVKDAPVPGPFSYMPCLLLDQVAPVILGVNLYGYKKQLAKFRGRADGMEIRSDLGQIALEFEHDGPAGTFADFAQQYDMASIRRMMEQTQVAYTPAGTRVFSFTDHHLDGATIQPVHTSLRIGRPFLEGDRKLHPFPSTNGKDLRAFRLTAQWTLTLPVADSNPAGQASPPNSRRFHTEVTNILARLRRLDFLK